MALPGHLLSFRDTDLQNADSSSGDWTIWFDLATGFAEPPEIRGTHTVVPGRDGQIIRPRRADHRLLDLPGIVRGVGADEDTRRSSWRTATDSVMALMDRTLDPGPLTVIGPYLGIPSDDEWTIDAVALRIIPGPIQASMTLQRWSIQLVAYDVDWVVESS